MTELRFPHPDDQDDAATALPDDPALAAAITRRLATSYASLPAAAPAVIEACARASRQPLVAAPRRTALRPRWWWGAAAAAVLVISIARPWRPETAQQHADSAVAASTPSRPDAVHFELTVPTTAREVTIVGDFNGWDAKATPMVHAGTEWSANVSLPPGRHVYAYVVDGTRWLIDPLAPQVPDAGYGPANAVVVEPHP